MLIPSPVRITSECCHAPDAVNVNIASSESVPVQLADKMAAQQMSSYPRYPHLLSPVYPAHTSSPALNTQTHVGHEVQPLLSNINCCAPGENPQQPYNTKDENLGTTRHILRY